MVIYHIFFSLGRVSGIDLRCLLYGKLQLKSHTFISTMNNNTVVCSIDIKISYKGS